MLTFDLDADGPPAPAGPDGEPRPGATSQRAYGARAGVFRIRNLNLLKSFGLPATFFSPGWAVDRHPDAVRSIVAGGHEIGHRGYPHVPPHEMAEEVERESLPRGIASIERASGRRPGGHRTPAWAGAKDGGRLA